MSCSLYNRKALEQHALAYKGLFNYTLFTSPFHTLCVPIY